MNRLLARSVLLLGAAAGLAATGCRAKEPPATEPFADDFERAGLGTSWNDTGGDYRISAGRLTVKNAFNHPLWLRRRLPPSVVVEVDATSRSPDGDLKMHLFGDGESFDPDKGANDHVTGYVFIFGGWRNTESWICRLGEHDDARKAGRKDVRVEPNRTYHFAITRRVGKAGGTIDWKIDGKPFLSWTDPEPLGGEGHEFLGFDDWEAEVAFDNLRIRPAP